MSSRIPTTVGLTLGRLALRGGHDGPHRDGWGVAFYEGNDALVLREPQAASESEMARYIEHHTPPSELVISHIRLATRGERTLQNTQPFQREMGGRVHIFAHNGDLPGVEEVVGTLPVCFKSIGETDSERAFCGLLNRIRPVWDDSDEKVPSLTSRMEIVVEFATELSQLGMANFLYSDGSVLFVHGHKRKQKNGQISPPGLHVLERTCDRLSADLSQSGVMLEDPCEEMTLVTSVPLSRGNWRPLEEGEVLAIANGEVVDQSYI